MPENVLEMKSIRKAFGPVQVLQGVDFSLGKAEIRALLGENGAGKSTLMNILGGVIHEDEGRLFLDGEAVHVPSPEAAQSKGIAFIHQELTLVNDLTIYENLFLGNELRKGFFLDVERMCHESKKTLNRMCIDLDPKTPVSALDASYKQIVEIARALLRNARILIMDEPTTALTDIEVRCVFEIMKSLKAQGVSIIFISHKLKEVFDVCDSYTVLRDGRKVADGATGDGADEHLLAKLMVGKELSYGDLYSSRKIGATILQVRNLTRTGAFNNANFSLGKGEVVGFTGLLGDGRSELLMTLFGFSSDTTGEVLLDGKRTKIASTTQAKKLGIGYVPRNRKENGIIRDMSVAQNTTITVLEKMRRGPFLDSRKETSVVETLVEELHIKMGDSSDAITSLSGGNQQKVVLSKWLAATPRILVLDNPTQGVDIGAKLEIYSIIMQLAKRGISVIVLSSEAQEVLMLCDWIYVMYHGEIRKELSREEATSEKIMILATGGSID